MIICCLDLKFRDFYSMVAFNISWLKIICKYIEIAFDFNSIENFFEYVSYQCSVNKFFPFNVWKILKRLFNSCLADFSYVWKKYIWI
jgi:hypothetical protein